MCSNCDDVWCGVVRSGVSVFRCGAVAALCCYHHVMLCSYACCFELCSMAFFITNKWSYAIIARIVFNDMFPLPQQSGVLAFLDRAIIADCPIRKWEDRLRTRPPGPSPQRAGGHRPIFSLPFSSSTGFGRVHGDA